MTESESVALPFGDSPIFCLLTTFWYYTRFFFSLQVLFFIFFNSYFSIFCLPLYSPQKRQKPVPPPRMAKVPDYPALYIRSTFLHFSMPVKIIYTSNIRSAYVGYGHASFSTIISSPSTGLRKSSIAVHTTFL